MDQIKIGKFIAEHRKKVNLTQFELSEMLGVTDRAVSKWERGKSMPDSSIMLELCKILKISVNELLRGEKIDMDNLKEKYEQTAFEMVKQKEESDRRLLNIEIVMGICCIIPLIVSIIVVNVINVEEWIKAVIVLSGLIPLLIATPFALRIEQKAGYYECKICGHKHIPKFSSVFWTMHINRTRYLRCPKCNKISWQKKVISKD